MVNFGEASEAGPNIVSHIKLRQNNSRLRIVEVTGYLSYISNFICYFSAQLIFNFQFFFQVFVKWFVVQCVYGYAKFSRIAFNNLGVFIDCKGRKIKWSYLKALFHLQEERLKFVNTLSRNYVVFKRH